MKERFQNMNINRTISKMLIAKTNEILADYIRQGFTLSLRQLYYQMIARDLFPKEWEVGGTKNNVRNYKKFGDLISNARLDGQVDWDAIEDRGRVLRLPPTWDDPAQIIRAAARGYAIDKWEPQPYHIEVMVEKDALSGVLDPVCTRLGVGLMANKGYSSSSAMYEAGKRMAAARRAGKNIVVLYFGDHDPSGMDMTRDVDERLNLFARGTVKVERLALNMDQVQQYQPPENPAKMTDSRAEDYVAQFGESSWELDALEPAVLAALVEDNVLSYRDADLWQAKVEQEADEKGGLELIHQNYDAVKEYVENL